MEKSLQTKSSFKKVESEKKKKGTLKEKPESDEELVC